MILQKFRTFAQIVGFATIALLGLYAAVTLFNSAKPASAAEVSRHEVVKSAPALQQETSTPTPAFGVPSLVNYQGMLRDREGHPLSGTYTMTFRIYTDVNAPVDSQIYKSIQHNVTVRDGRFSVLLGDDPEPMTPDLFNNPNRYVGITLEGFDEMLPRQRFASVPYAIQAGNAFMLSAKDGGPFDAVVVNEVGKVGIGTTNPEALLQVDSSRYDHLDWGNYQWGMIITSGGGSAKGLKISTAWGGHPDVPLFQANAGSLKDQSEVQRFVIEANGNVGIGAQVPEFKLDVNGRMRIQGEGGGSSAGIWLHDSTSPQSGFVGMNTEDTMGFYGSSAGWGLLMNTTNGNVGIGTDNPQTKLDVNGDLHVQGKITNFKVLGPSDAEAHGKNGLKSVDLGSSMDSICFLTKVKTYHVENDSDTALCGVNEMQGKWQLTAQSTGNGNAVCTAMCFSWSGK